MMPYPIYDYINQKTKNFFFDENVSSIMIPYHIKSYVVYGATKSMEKVLYSDRFYAITYHIKKHHLHKLYSLTENINFENTKYAEDNCGFILLPKDRQKIVLENNIFFEIVLDEIKSDENEKKETTTHTKKYIYKLTKMGKESIGDLEQFLEKIQKEYQTDVLNKTTQMVFEYKKSVKDDDDDEQTAIYSETPFKTNKSFDNLFFRQKQDYLKFIMPFIDTTEDIKRQYEKTGNAFKAIMMLHGPPGCGKSSLIKATIKKTGRHCVLVPWTKIKTCDDFVSLFRPIKINNRVYQQNELIIVFEDFDANDNDIIKARTGLKPKVEVKAGVKKDIKDFTTAELLHLASFNLKDIPSTTFTCKESDSDFASSIRNGVKRYDELTLEYILNVLDGIVELHESIVFFTTNDIDIIDPALKRNGRVNYILNMEYTDQKTMREMISYHYSVPVPLKRIPVKSKMSYADLSAICNYCKTVDECLDTIRNKI